MISIFQIIKESLSPLNRHGNRCHPPSESKHRHPMKDLSPLEVTPIDTALSSPPSSSSPVKRKKKRQRKYDSLPKSTTRIVSQPVKSKNHYDDDPCLISNSAKPREESLPPYTCSVKKSGKMYIKREMDHHYQPSADRRWKGYCVHLHGTLLNVFTCIPLPRSERRKRRRKPILLLQHGLQGAKVGWACDYEQRPYILRLYSTITGEQVLLRPAVNDHNGKTDDQEEKGLRAMVEWIEQIQAAINISMDIDEQKMPTFVTLARSHYRHHTNMATVVLDQSKLAVQTCPDRGMHTSITITNSNSNNSTNNTDNNKITTKWRRGFKKW